jgi:RNA polymerase sigma-70 factor, ECF subfamily
LSSEVVRRMAPGERIAGTPAAAGGLGEDSATIQALAARAGTDADAFAELYDIYVDQVHAFAYRMLGSRAEAEDVTAEAFAKALAGMGRFTWRNGGFGAWLLRITRNLCYDSLRRRARLAPSPVEQDELSSDQPGPEQMVLHDETLSRLRGLVGELPDHQREAVLLKYAARLSNREIGEVTGRSATAVSSLLNRATAKLRERLGQADD